MRLVVAEKPSVARMIAEVLGATTVKKGYLQNEEYLVSWCIGHLVELAKADDYKEEWKQWSYETLPIIPDVWMYHVKEQTGRQYEVLEKLFHDPSVTEVICATDAGREGELIFRLVYRQAGCKLPVKRLWISSMEERAIQEGFVHLRDSSAYDHLYQSALCRSQADWLVGINATRLFSSLYRHKLTVGRVQTPTLAMLVEREQEISEFEKEQYYKVHITCGGVDAVTERIDDKKLAEQMAKECLGRQAFVLSGESVTEQIHPPKLYNLTSLQREANRLLGYTAQQTLDYAQSLYEKQLITYPRTDSRYLTVDMSDRTLTVISMLMKKVPALKGLMHVPDIQRIIDNEKITDHHAIIPTEKIKNTDLNVIPGGERDLLILIAIRLLSASSEPYVCSNIRINISCQDSLFVAKAKATIHEGWKRYESRFRKQHGEEAEVEVRFPDLTEGMRLTVENAEVSKHVTSPPKHHTEDTLLAAMEHIGKETQTAGAERKGIGTPATRAAIIEKLVQNGFVVRKERSMLPTDAGIKLITVLPEIIKSPELTAKWEYELEQISKGEKRPELFMNDIRQMVRELVDRYHEVDETKRWMFAPPRKPIGKCPRCGGDVYESESSFYCGEKCRFVLFKNDGYFTSLGKELDKSIVIPLLRDGKVKVSNLTSKRTGTKFQATISLDVSGEYPSFKMEFENRKSNKKGEAL